METVDKYDVKKFPTLMVLTGDSTEPSIYPSSSYKHEKLFEFLKPFAKDYETAQQQKKSGKGQISNQEEKPFRNPKEEIKDNETLKKMCFEKKMCGLAILDPNNASEDEMESYIAVLAKLSETSSRSFNFGWISGEHKRFLDTLRLSDQFPQFILLGEKKWNTHFGAFSTEAIQEFFDRVNTGAQRLLKMQELPELETFEKLDEL